MPVTLLQSWVVMRRELRKKLCTRSFVLSLAAALLVVVGMGVLQFQPLEQHNPRNEPVTVVASAPGHPVARALCRSWQDASLVARCAVVSPGQGPADAVVAVDARRIRIVAPAELGSPGMAVARAVAWEQLAGRAGLSGAQVHVSIDTRDHPETGLGRLLAAALGGGFLLAGGVAGHQLATSIVEDRVLGVHTLLRHVIPVRSLVLGKLAANISMFLLQMAVLVGGFAALQRNAPSALAGMGGHLIATCIPLFVLGYLNACILWALIGLAARSMDVLRWFSLPVHVALAGVWCAGMYTDGALRSVLSYMPIASGLVMPVRVALRQASAQDVVVAELLSVVTGALLVVALRGATSAT